MVKTALIVSPDESGLNRVFGVPVVRRLILLAKQAGIDTVHVLSRGESVLSAVSDLAESGGLHRISHSSELTPFVSDLDLQGESVLVMEAAQVIDQRSLDRLLRAEDGQNVFLRSSKEHERFGRTTGICVVRAVDLPRIVHEMWTPDAAISRVSVSGETLEATPGLPVRIRSGREAGRTAEAALLNAVRLITDEHEYGFLARRLGRPLSRRMSAKLARIHVPPNGLTLFNMAVGLAGALFLSIGGYWPQLAGAFLFLLSVILDGVDGEVARLTLRQTRFGHYLDIISDNVVHTAVFAGIAVGLYRETLDPLYIHALLFMIGGFALCILAVHGITRHRPDKPGASEVPRLVSLLVNRDFAYLLSVLALIGHLNWFVLASAPGTYIVALYLAIVGRSRRSGSRKAAPGGSTEDEPVNSSRRYSDLDRLH